MKKILTTVLVLVLMVSSVLAVGVGTGVGVTIEPEEFAPRVFMDPSTRVVRDDYNEPGATSTGGEELVERIEYLEKQILSINDSQEQLWKICNGFAEKQDKTR